jgi:phosphatidate cytidylyltransferase
MDSNMVRRVAFAAVAIPVALGIVWFGGWPLALTVSLVSALGTREFYDLALKNSIDAARRFGIASAALCGPLALLASPRGPLAGVSSIAVVIGWWPYLGALWILALLVWALARRAPTTRPLEAVAVTAFGVLYTGALPAFLIAIRHSVFGGRSWAGTWLVFFPMVVIWVCDSAAMSGGRAIGGAKLAPTISPGKTRSGSTAGVLGGLLVAPIFGYLVFPRVGINASVMALLVIAALLSVLGQLGDLAESLFKREVGVKDSSHLIPGHGGVLDRFDSLYFALPITAFCYTLFGIPG